MDAREYESAFEAWRESESERRYFERVRVPLVLDDLESYGVDCAEDMLHEFDPQYVWGG